MAALRIDDLAAIIDALAAQGRLARVQSEADPRHELGGIAHALEGGARAVLFERPRGHRWPVLAGLYADRTVLAALLGVDAAQVARHVAARAERRTGAGFALVGSGLVLGVTEGEADLGKIPVPVHAPRDGGACFTAAVLIAKDPESGARIVAMPQAQVMARDSLRLNVEAEGPIAIALEKARRLGRSLWITLNCGAGLGVQIAAAMPGAAAGEEVLAVAAAIEGAAVPLVAGRESDVEVAANAMWALECEIVPGETGRAGPFATAAGHYAPAGDCPVAHVRRVHRRETPVFHTILPGLEARTLAGLAGEIRLCALLRSQVPGFIDACLTAGGGHFRHAVVQVSARVAESAKQAILAAFAAFPPLKLVTVVDETVNIRDSAAVEGAMADRFDASTGLVRIQLPDSAGGVKLGFDATQALPRRADQEAIVFKPVALEKHAIAGAAAIATPLAAPPAPARVAPTPSVAASIVSPPQPPEGPAEPVMSAPEETTPAPKPAQNADWDEDRWLKRELEAMKRDRSTNAPAAAPTIAPRPAAKPAPRAAAPKPEAVRAERPAEDDEGSFFRGGTP